MNSQAGGLLEGYRAMANDKEHETEALEWSEGLIGDANLQEGWCLGRLAETPSWESATCRREAQGLPSGRNLSY